MKVTSKRRVWMIAALVLLALFLVRPGAARLKSRIIYSMSAALGRPVDIGSVHLRFLPRPGFDLENLVVYDDPAFGGEPILRASEVTADLRLLSLVRRRIEISRLDLTDPSLNLVHGQNGRWNLEALLERTSHTPLAPTSKAKSEPRPGFPYIEASSARINLKNGPEKKPYALTNADFSLWQDSENTWGVRLKAQPFRTDLNLTDVGLLQISGSWQRADSLRNTPLQLDIDWSRAQLGQVTKFFTGNDQGWRGAGELTLKLTGTPASLQIASTVSVQDFRRYDITSGDALRMAAVCTARYSSTVHVFDDVDCQAPVGKGLLTLKGTSGLPSSHNRNLILTADNVPATSALALLERAKKNLTDDLVASGTIKGSFLISENASESRFEGQGEMTDLQLSSAAEKTQIGPQTIPFWLIQGRQIAPTLHGTLKHVARTFASIKSTSIPDGPRLEFGPIALTAGRTSPSISGWINRSGYDLSITGEGEISRILRIARLAGVPAVQANADGDAQFDLQLAGPWVAWSGPTPVASGPQVVGSAKLRNVRVAVRGAAEPVQISFADLQLASDAVHVRKLTARAAGSPWTGSLDLPRGCGTPAACFVHFDVKTNDLSFSGLADFAHPRAKDRPWYRVLETVPAAPSFFAAVHGSGRITADNVQLKNLVASGVSANVTLDSGKVEISQLNANLLGGKHTGRWEADFTAKPGRCGGSGSLTGISLAQVAQAMNDGWITGAANATYELKGDCPADFWSSAEGTLAFEARDGSLPHIALSEATPLKFNRVSGHAKLHDAKLQLEEVKLETPFGSYQLTGTTSSERTLNLKLTKAGVAGTSGFTVSGTLSDPHVLQIGPEQAQLKP